MWELINIEKLTEEKFLNYYKLTYLSPNGKKVTWCMASRNGIEELVCKKREVKGDAVCIIPKVLIDGEPALIITKEYRLPVGDYVYGFPAGLIDEGENPLLAAARELKEEIGVTKFGNINVLSNACFNSEGLTDETTIVVEAEILKIDKQELQDEEDITYEIVKLKDIEEYIKDKKLGVKAAMYIPMIVREYKLLKKNMELEKQLEELTKKNNLKRINY